MNQVHFTLTNALKTLNRRHFAFLATELPTGSIVSKPTTRRPPCCLPCVCWLRDNKDHGCVSFPALDHPNGFLQQWVCFMSWFGKWGLVCVCVGGVPGGLLSTVASRTLGVGSWNGPEECQGRDFKAHQILCCCELESSHKSFPESEAAPLDEEESLLSPRATLVRTFWRFLDEAISLLRGREVEEGLNHEWHRSFWGSDLDCLVE